MTPESSETTPSRINALDLTARRHSSTIAPTAPMPTTTSRPTSQGLVPPSLGGERLSQLDEGRAVADDGAVERVVDHLVFERAGRASCDGLRRPLDQAGRLAVRPLPGDQHAAEGGPIQHDGAVACPPDLDRRDRASEEDGPE